MKMKEEEEKQQKEDREQKEEVQCEDKEEMVNSASQKKPESVSAPMPHPNSGKIIQKIELLLERVKHEGDLEVSH